MEAVHAAYAPDAVWEDNTGLWGDWGTPRGPEGIQAAWRRWYEAFDEVQFEWDEVSDAGDDVVVTYRSKARGRGSGAVVDQASRSSGPCKRERSCASAPMRIAPRPSLPPGCGNSARTRCARLARAALGRIRREGERAALRVTAYSQALTGMDHGAAEVLDALKRGGEIGHGEVGQRSGVTRSRSALVHSQAKVAALGLPSLTCDAGPRRELCAQHAAPEPPGAFRVVGRELDQWSRHDLQYRGSSSPSDRGETVVENQGPSKEGPWCSCARACRS